MDFSVIGASLGTVAATAWAAWQASRTSVARKDAEQARTEAKIAKEEVGDHKATAALGEVHIVRVAELERQLAGEQERAEKIELSWSTRYEKNQKFHHDQATTAQALLFKCQEECANLRATRDFGPILEYMRRQDEERKSLAEDRREQSRVNAEIFGAIRGLTAAVNTLNQKIGGVAVDVKEVKEAAKDGLTNEDEQDHTGHA